MGNPVTRSDPEDTPVSNGSVFSRGGICRGLSEVQRRCFVGCSTFLGSVNFRGRAIFLPPISPRRLQTSCLSRSVTPTAMCEAHKRAANVISYQTVRVVIHVDQNWDGAFGSAAGQSRHDDRSEPWTWP